MVIRKGLQWVECSPRQEIEIVFFWMQRVETNTPARWNLRIHCQAISPKVTSLFTWEHMYFTGSCISHHGPLKNQTIWQAWHFLGETSNGPEVGVGIYWLDKKGARMFTCNQYIWYSSVFRWKRYGLLASGSRYTRDIGSLATQTWGPICHCKRTAKTYTCRWMWANGAAKQQSWTVAIINDIHVLFRIIAAFIFQNHILMDR